MLKAGAFLQNRYEIIYRIGSGGMADVYKAKDHKLNRFVAIKVLKQEFRDDTAFLSKFRVEAQAAAGMSHPNIVNVYDVGEDRGISFIVMELVEGITLKDYISKKGKLSVRESTSIALQITAGLEAAHNNGIVHRDIKPQNILISMDGKAKVSDFGIARTVNANTINSSAMGSVHYASPEQTRGGYSDAKSDIYSLGITMFEMVTGRVPFDGESTVEVALKHLQEEIPSPRKYASDIPFSTEQIILKCTQKSPDRRYANMTELIRDLKESLVNPTGNFVIINGIDRKGQTRKISKEELEQIKNGSMPTYDSDLDVGVASSLSDSGNVQGDGRDYARRGGYYHDSSYQQNERFSEMKDYRYRDDDEYDLYDSDPEDDEIDIDRGRRTSRPDRILIGVSVLAALAIGIGVIIILGRAIGVIGSTQKNSDPSAAATSEQIAVPSLLGKTEEEARVLLEGMSLNYMKQGEAPSATYGVGLITGQAVEEGTMVTSGTSIPCMVSSGSSQPITMPDLTNNDQAAAESALASLGVQVIIDTSRHSDTVESGHVIATNPGAGSAVSAGESVRVYINQSQDNNLIPVLNVEGKYENDAITALTLQGLIVFVSQQSSDTVAEGLVISQDIAPDSSVPANTVITLTVSTGPENTGSDVTMIDEANDPGVWKCNVQLNAPEGYDDEPVRITLLQGDTETTLFEGRTTFPYILNVAGQPGVSTGTLYVYSLDPSTWEVTQTTAYENVVFSKTDE